jgi:dephospho-CoA kinase
MTAAAHHIPRLGLTGGIGSGKSTALAYLHEFGAAVASSDDIVHRILSRPDIVAEVAARHGKAVLAGDDVNRAALASIVFHDDAELEWLEHLLHPHVRQEIERWAAAQVKARPRPALIAVEVPLLFESGMESLFDSIMLVTAPSDMRRRRLSAKLTDSDFARRLSQQMPEAEKMAHSRFVFHNTGSRKALRDFVGQTVAQILAGDEKAAGGGEGEQTT